MKKPSKSITILQLYPHDMNIYGDWGNVLTLKKRLEWRGFDVNLTEHNVGDAFPNNVDIVIGGGGQDSGQLRIRDDLQRISPKLKKLADNGTPMLVICGLYQLFGRSFTTKDGDVVPGAGIFDLETVGDDKRIVGNIVLNSSEFGEIIGYENHSGLTTLDPSLVSLGEVVKGVGNNNTDSNEGARYHNVIGTYLHGPLLPKNPRIADWILAQAINRKYGEASLEPLKDQYVDQARAIASKRPR